MNRSTWLMLVSMVVVAALVALAAVLVLGWAEWAEQADEQEQTALPVLYDAPQFTLVNSQGEPLSNEDLAGEVWVASFIFTRCTSICPVLTPRLATLQNDLPGLPHGEDVRLVSFSVDPTHDRPEVLADYASQHGAEPGRWTFLTGERDEIWRLVEEGFKLPVEETMARQPGMAIMHSDKLALVDREGRIRGYYSGLEDEDMAQLREDLRRLLDQGGR